MTERGVSDLVGFILIFGIIMTGATFALVVGQDEISNIRTNEQSVNAERAMVLVGQSLDGLDRSRSASTVGSVNLNDGSLRLTAGENVTVSVENGTTGRSWTWTVPTGSLEYELDDTVLSYENGMVSRSDRGNGISLSDPHLTCAEDRAIVSVITLNRTGSQQVGSGRVSIVGHLNETRLLYPVNRTGVGSPTNATDVFVDVNSTHTDVWNATVEDHSSWNWTTSPDGEYRCDVGDDGRVVFRRTVIDVRFDR